jgi:hypothetical protein
MEEQTKNLEYRMYFLTPYNLSPIQAGIQSLHGVVEYQLLYGDNIEYLTWAKHWKTAIILNGGTSNNAGSHMYENPINNPNNTPFYGTMEQHGDALTFSNIKYAAFFEPDANNMLTSIAFLCDERVFKTKQRSPEDVYYPGFEEWLSKFKLITTVDETLNVRTQYAKEFEEWVEFVGGEQNVFLRNFVSKFKLADN